MMFIPHPFHSPEVIPWSAFFGILIYLSLITLAFVTSYKDRVKFFEKGSPFMQVTFATSISLLLMWLLPVSSFIILAFDGLLSIGFWLYFLSIIFATILFALMLIFIIHNMEREHEIRWVRNTKKLQKAYDMLIKREREKTQELSRKLNSLSITEQHKLEYDDILPRSIKQELTYRVNSIRDLKLEGTLPKIAEGIAKLITLIPSRQSRLLATPEGKGLLRVVADKSQEIKRDFYGHLTMKEEVVEKVIIRMISQAQLVELSDFEKSEIASIAMATRKRENKIKQDITELLDAINNTCFDISQDQQKSEENVDKLLQSTKLSMMDIRSQITQLGKDVENMERKAYEVTFKRGNIFKCIWLDLLDLVHT